MAKQISDGYLKFRAGAAVNMLAQGETVETVADSILNGLRRRPYTLAALALRIAGAAADRKQGIITGHVSGDALMNRVAALADYMAVMGRMCEFDDEAE